MWDFFTPVFDTLASAGTWALGAVKEGAKAISEAAGNIEMPGGGGLETSTAGESTLIPVVDAAPEAATSNYVNSLPYTGAENADWTASSGAGVPETSWLSNAASATGKWIEKNPTQASMAAQGIAGGAKSLMDYWKYREERDDRERRINPVVASSGDNNYASHYQGLLNNRR